MPGGAASTAPEKCRQQLERQRAQCARCWKYRPQRILPLSAQKGLEAKMEQRNDLLQDSGLPAFEDALARASWRTARRSCSRRSPAGCSKCAPRCAGRIQIRRRDLDEQMMELNSLRGKNATVIDSMRQRIEQEQRSFEASSAQHPGLAHGALALDEPGVSACWALLRSAKSWSNWPRRWSIRA